MTKAATHDVTRLLQSWSDGDAAALGELVEIVQPELRRIARHYMAREQAGHTLQTTALINELYVRLLDWRTLRWQDRAHFFAVSASLMRRTLVDYARRRRYRKRGGGAIKVSLDEAAAVSVDRGADLVAIDDALRSLAALDARKSQVVELRFFGLERGGDG